MHFKDHSNFNNLMCWCGRKFPSRTVFRNHRTWHGRRNQCHICGKMLHVCKQNFSDHLNICGDLGLVDPLQCELCPKIFKTDQSFKSHARVHAIRTLECAHCSKKFHRKPQILEHMALHTKKFPYKCHLCQAKFTRLCNLRSHVNNNHRYMCFLCSKQFSSAELAKVHVQASHTQAEIAASGMQGGFMRITKFECTVCGRCLASKQTLLNHEKTHQKSGQATGDCEDDNAAAQATGELKDAS